MPLPRGGLAATPVRAHVYRRTGTVIMAIHRRDTRLLTRALLPALLTAALVAGAAAPGLAQPADVPDPGSRPAPEGELRLPDGSYAAPAPKPREGPLAAEIAKLELRIGQLAAELDTLTPEAGPAASAAQMAETAWQAAAEEFAAAEAAFEEEVGEAYRDNSGVPARLFGRRLRDLTAHAPIKGVDAAIGAEAAARRLLRAEREEQVTAAALAEARAAERTLAEDIDELEAELAGLEDDLAGLLDRNADLLVDQRREEEAAEQERADEYPVIEPVDGLLPGRAARRAVAEALKHLGKPYQWGAEGPNRFDCSGLVLYSYRKAGVNRLPRVAADQYHATRNRMVARSVPVAQRGLLPGDLIFYSPNAFDYRSISHVVMYIGNGRVVQAPSTGDVVKISPIWWSNFFAATRVVDAVPDPNAAEPPENPGGGPSPSPGPGSPTPPTTPPPSTSGPGRSPTPGPPTSPSPAPSPTPPESPTPPPSGSGPGEQTPPPSSEAPLTPSPSPSPTPTPSPSPEPTGSPDAVEP